MALSANDEQLLLEVYQKIIDNSPNLIFLIKKHFLREVSAEGIPMFVYANKTAREALNYSLEEFINPTTDQTRFFHPADMDKVKERFKARLEKDFEAKTLDRNMLDIRLLSKEGEIIPVLYRMVTIDESSDENDPLFHFDGIDLRPIERKEEEIKILKKRYEYFLKESPDGMYSADKEGTLTYVNESAVKKLDYDSADQVIGKNLANDLYYSSVERDIFLRKLSEKGFLSNYPICLKNEGGELRIVSTTSVLIKDDDGNILGVDGLIRDISEKSYLKKLQLDLVKNSRGKLKSMNIDTNLIKENDKFSIVNALELFQEYRKSVKDDSSGSNSKEINKNIEVIFTTFSENVLKYERIKYIRKLEKERAIQCVNLTKIVKDILETNDKLNLQRNTELIIPEDDILIKGKSSILLQLLNIIFNEKYITALKKCNKFLLKIKESKLGNEFYWEFSFEIKFGEEIITKEKIMRNYGIEEYLLGKMIRNWGGKVYITEKENSLLFQAFFQKYKPITI